MPELPPRIARIGLAVELENGQKMFLVSDKVAGFLEVDRRTQYGRDGYGNLTIVDHGTDIYITDLRGYSLISDADVTMKQLDSMSTAIEETRNER